MPYPFLVWARMTVASLMSSVQRGDAPSQSNGRSRPSRSTGKTVRLQPRGWSDLQASIVAGCSPAVSAIVPGAIEYAAPNSARFDASVPPLVKMTSSG